MIKNTSLHQLGEDAKREQKKITYRGHVTWLRKRRAKPGKMCNQLFLLSEESGQRPDNHMLRGKNEIEVECV